MKFKVGDIVRSTGLDPDIRKNRLFIISEVDKTYIHPYTLQTYPELTEYDTLANDQDLVLCSKLDKVLA